MSEMKDFETFKKQAIEENEKKYGEEIREKYGEDAAQTSTNIIMGLTEEKWIESEKLRQQYETALKEAVVNGYDLNDPKVIEMCRAHGKWVSMFWEDGAYSYEAHRTLAEVYTQDERFMEYYENIAPGAAEYLSKAVINYCLTTEKTV